MTRITLATTAPAAAADPARTGRLIAHVRTGWQRFLQRRRQEATVHMLQGLDDRTLSDIGLKRSEIELVANSKAAGRRQRYVDIVWGASRG